MRLKQVITAVTVTAIIIVAGSILLYSDEWPPVYVVESESMSHSYDWTFGTINVGDVVFVKNMHGDASNVITYVQGRETNYMTYGEYGDVMLYRASTGEIIIHRAMFYLSWNGSTPQVAGYTGQNWIKITSSAIIIDNASYTGRNLIVYTGNMVGKDGFITVGDYNLAHSDLYNSSVNAYEAADQNVFGYNPAGAKSVVGIAFGQVPWVGLIKLNIMRLYGGWPQYNQVPNHAYLYLGILIIAILTLILFPYDHVRKRK